MPNENRADIFSSVEVLEKTLFSGTILARGYLGHNMHHVSEIQIKNFRSFKEDKIKLSAYTALVGYNNAGKSNLMDALKWVLRGSALGDNDFNNTAEAVCVEATIQGVDEGVLAGLGANHRPRLENFITEGMLKIRRAQDRPGGVARDARLFVWHPDEEEWKINPAGLDAAIKTAFPDPIVVGAMENAADDASKFAKSSTIGRILSDILEPLREEQADEVAKAFSLVEQVLSAEGENKAKELRVLDEKIAPELSNFFPGLEAKIHIDSPSLDNLIKSGTIKVTEQGFAGAKGQDITCLGHGAQRSVQMALLKVLSEIRRAQGAIGTTLLMIDEPELYLHPQAIEFIRSALKTLSQEGYQVIFSTHSPQMITAFDAANVVLMRKTMQQGSHARKGLGESITDVIEGAEHQSELLFSLSNASKFLFSERVVLAEGKTEKHVFPHLFEAITGKTLAEVKLAFIDLGGVDNVPNAMAVLNGMDLPTKSIVDMDFAFKGACANGLLPTDDPDINQCKDALKELQEEHGFELDADGLPRKGNGFTTDQIRLLLAGHAEASKAIERLHIKLKGKNIWMWTLGPIEAHLGLEGKNPAVWSRLVVRLHEEELDDVVPDRLGVVELCRWLQTD